MKQAMHRYDGEGVRRLVALPLECRDIRAFSRLSLLSSGSGYE